MAITDLEMADLVREVCYDMGAGPLVLGGPLSGYRAFADAVSEGAQFPYMIVGIAEPAQWEAGTGALDGSGRLVRTPVASSAGGGVVDFGAGEKRVGLALHSGWAAAVEAHGHGIAGVAGLGAALAGKQDAHANLTAIAGQASAADQLSYWTGAGTAGMTGLGALGRGLIGAVDAAAARGVLGLGAMATQQPGAVAISGGAISGITDLAVADGGTGASSAAAARANLGLSIGSDVQAHDGQLDAIAALATTSFGRGALARADAATFRSYIGAGTSSTSGTVTSVAMSGGTSGLSISGGPVTGAGTMTLGGTLAIANGGTGSTSAGSARAGLGLAIGADVQGYSANLAAIAGLTTAADRLSYWTGAGVAATTTLTSFGRSLVDDLDAAAGRTTLGLGTMAVQDAAAIAISGGFITGITDLAVADGGTGASTAAQARTNLGLGTIATQAASAVNVTGGTIGGLSSLSVTTIGAGASANIAVSADAAQNSFAYFSATGQRWAFGRAGGAETGSDAGSNFAINAYSDAGSYKNTPFQITRSSGVVTMGLGISAAQIAPLATNSYALGTSALRWSAVYGVAGDFSGAISSGGTIIGKGLIASRIGDAADANINFAADVGRLSQLVFYSGAISAAGLRWAFGKSGTAESGANAGSNYFIARYADDGTSLGTAISIIRSTGETSIGGNILPITDNARTLGSSSFRWSTVYAGSGTINTSDARLKRDIGGVGDALLDVWSNVGWSRYRFIDAWEAKGEGARWHVGLIAQQVRDAIDARLGEGAAVTLGLVCHDCWDALDEQRDEDGHVTRPGRAAGDRWGLRYEECLAVEAAWQRRRMARIEARLDALEARDVAG